MNKEREREFRRELSALSRKYRIIVDGCGCCDSPFLSDLDECGDPNGTEYNEALRWVPAEAKL